MPGIMVLLGIYYYYYYYYYFLAPEVTFGFCPCLFFFGGVGGWGGGVVGWLVGWFGQVDVQLHRIFPSGFYGGRRECCSYLIHKSFHRSLPFCKNPCCADCTLMCSLVFQ